MAGLDPAALWPAHPMDGGPDGLGCVYFGAAGLKHYRRTGNPLWLERARAFAMSAIDQVRGARAAFGRGRYSLWTADVGLAVSLWDCITGEPKFPTVDVV